MAPLTLVMATRNAGKVREMAELLKDLGVRLRSLADFPEIPDIPEVGATFADNAAAKAKAVAQLTGLPALADDSGLEVRPLRGGRGCIRPGTPRTAPAGVPPPTGTTGRSFWMSLSMSRRSSGPPALSVPWPFLSRTAASSPPGGSWPVLSAGNPGAPGGLAMTRCFVVPAYQATVAELDQATKNRISHRGEALRKLKAALLAEKKEFFLIPPE